MTVRARIQDIWLQKPSGGKHAAKLSHVFPLAPYTHLIYFQILIAPNVLISSSNTRLQHLSSLTDNHVHARCLANLLTFTRWRHRSSGSRHDVTLTCVTLMPHCPPTWNFNQNTHAHSSFTKHLFAIFTHIFLPDVFFDYTFCQGELFSWISLHVCDQYVYSYFRKKLL